MSNRYYYHKSSNTCRGFHYTGCGKSRNNFRKYDECKNRCIQKNEKENLNITSILSSTANITSYKSNSYCF